MAMDHEDGVAPPSNDAYTGMLSISLLALIGACVLIYLDYSRYPDANPPPIPGSSSTDKKAEPTKSGDKPADAPKADFQFKSKTIDLKPEQDKTIELQNGKADPKGSSVNPKDAGVTIDVLETEVKVIVGDNPTAEVYTVTIKSTTGETARLTVNVKKEKGE